LATGWGKSAISIIRISGPHAKQALKLTKPETAIYLPRQAYFRTFYDIFDPKKRPIDQGILLFYQKPKSFTGEDLIELQIHGGLAVKDKMLDTLS
jgi:tRNA modification GTPase